MSIIDALVLGILQGLTEFLPVSSSGHIEIGKALLHTEVADNLLFSILVHGATTLSTIVVFRKDIGSIIKGLLQFRYNTETQYTLKILISMIPVGIAGIFFKDDIEQLFTGNMLLVGTMLLITAALLSFAYFRKPDRGDVTYGKAFLIGISQAFAILPGLSRSGATISTALLTGISKEKAARFSFLMVLLPIIGAVILELKDYIDNPLITEGISGISLSVGFVAAFLSGIVACTWMINIVKKGKLIYFAIYCTIIGIIAITTYFI